MRADVMAGVLFCGTIYFGAQVFTGDHGLVAWSENQETEAVLRVERDRLAADVARLEDRIARLTPPFIDDDYLEELARAQSLSAADERLTHLANARLVPASGD